MSTAIYEAVKKAHGTIRKGFEKTMEEKKGRSILDMMQQKNPGEAQVTPNNRGSLTTISIGAQSQITINSNPRVE